MFFLTPRLTISMNSSKPSSALTKWSFDLNLSEQDIGYEVLKRCPLPYGMKRVHEFEKEVENEGGSEHDIAVNKAAQALLQRKRQHAMAQAMSPGKQLLMQAFMLYMSGKQLNLFSISVTSMAILNPIKSVLNTNHAFKQFEDEEGKVELQIPKLIWIFFNLLYLIIGLYKMSSLRLLPTTSADWANTVVFKEMLEHSRIP